MNYASIVPLIGGETLGIQNVLKQKPEYLLSYTAFAANDSHLVEYYNKEVPYYNLDEVSPKLKKVDIINTVCPCAGLSSFSSTAGSDNDKNDWMTKTANYVLEELQPKVFWGENAPRLASNMGKPIVEKLKAIGAKNGYVFSIYKTKSLKHGLGQVRDRTFYFFWKDTKIPTFSFFDRERERIEETIRNTHYDSTDPMCEITNKHLPTDNPWYQYVLNVVHGGITHQELQNKLEKSTTMFAQIEHNCIKYNEVSEWMRKQGYTREADKAMRMFHKLNSGGNIMRRSTEIPKDYIGAFVGHLPTSLTHPDQNRYLTIRECMKIMKLPDDFILQGGIKNLNHICQNVPVTTAEDMAGEIVAYLDGRKHNEMISTDFLIQDNKSQKLVYEHQSLGNFFV